MKKFIISIAAPLGYGLLGVAFFLSVRFASDSLFQASLTLANLSTHPTVVILTDVLLVALLLSMHRLMSSTRVKHWLTKHMPKQFRSLIYGLSVAVVAIIVTQLWVTTDLYLWNITHPFMKNLFILPHLLAWALIGWTVFHVDHIDLLGLRPAFTVDEEYGYYGGKAISKSSALRRLVPYPMSTACLLIVWSVPVFSLDRLMLAAGLTVYILLSGWNKEKSSIAISGAI